MTTHSKPRARFAAALGAVAIATLTALGGAAPAWAAPDNIDPTVPRSLTVHTFAEPPTASGLPSNGSELTPEQRGRLTPVPGITVTVEQVPGIDLMTDEGWAEAAALTPATAASRIAGNPPAYAGSRVTDATGAAAFPGLPMGVFLVSGPDIGDNELAFDTTPFLVTLPTPLDNTWLYDVNVYPKSALTGITKTVDETAAFGLGDDVTWTIRAAVPEVGADNDFSSFIIRDQLDPRLTDPRVSVSADGVRLADEDYVLSVVDGLVTVDFTQSGLGKLEAANAASIIVTIVTEVTALGDGVVPNTAELFINDRATADAISSDSDQTGWGTLSILKHEQGNEGAVLGGATFQVFVSQADALARTNPISVTSGGVASDTFTSADADGIAFIPGLNAGDYWLVETAAPAGYRPLTAPLPVTVEEGDVARESINVAVPNAQVPAYELPITGGTGQAAFMIGGVGLLASALGVALVRRRRQRADA